MVEHNELHKHLVYDINVFLQFWKTLGFADNIGNMKAR